ncbi:MAG: hypothetical protein PVSMB4_14210 [Ktedonobacterales bacterium]
MYSDLHGTFTVRRAAESERAGRAADASAEDALPALWTIVELSFPAVLLDDEYGDADEDDHA